MTWMKHTVQNEQANLGRNPLAVSGIARPTKTHMRRGIHRIIGSVSAHVRHSVSSAAAARRTEGLDPEIARIGALEAAEVMDLLGCGPRGLTEQQAHRIRSVHGANIIAPEHHDPLAARLSRAFLTPFTLILLALAAISLYTNVYLAAPGDEDPSTAIIIGVMVLISGGISFWQDTRGAAAADALKGLVSITCRCVREDTGAAEIPLADVVPGDLIELAAGDIIPADLRIVTAKDLFLTQAALTGSPTPSRSAGGHSRAGGPRARHRRLHELRLRRNDRTERLGHGRGGDHRCPHLPRRHRERPRLPPNHHELRCRRGLGLPRSRGLHARHVPHRLRALRPHQR